MHKMNLHILFIFTKLASTVGLFVVVAFIIVWLTAEGQIYNAFILGLTTLLLTITVTGLKKVFRVARPTTASLTLSSYAFPSAHAAGATFLAMVLIAFSRDLAEPLRYSILLVCSLTALAIAYSRLHFKVHTLLQVTAGISIGLLFGIIFIALLR